MGDVNPRAGDKNIRILGLTEQPMKLQDGVVRGKLSGVYNELNRSFEFVGLESTYLPPAARNFNRLRSFRPNIERWRNASSINPSAFAYRTRLAEEHLQKWEGRYHLIFQSHTLFAPGTSPGTRPYVLTTDNTFMMSERHWPDWVPMASRRQRDAWVELERAVYENASFLFPWSDFARQSMIEDYGIAPEKVIAAGAGANLSSSTLAERSYDSQIALFVGYAFERKGGHTLLNAWPEVRCQLPQARLLIVGPRKPQADPMPGVEWLGRLPREELVPIYEQATVFVMPSLFEPWGHVFLEAMGFGVPCIGSNCCAMPEFILADQTGLLVPPGEAGSLTEALIAILGDPDKAETMGRAAHANVLENHTWDAVLARMTPYIREAAANG
jgi:glycosyltransferase involved in cell wall biosynthesis